MTGTGSACPPAGFDWRAAAGGDIAGMRVAYSPDLGMRPWTRRSARSSTRPSGCSSVTLAAPSSARTRGGPTLRNVLGPGDQRSDLAGLRNLAASLATG